MAKKKTSKKTGSRTKKAAGGSTNLGAVSTEELAREMSRRRREIDRLRRRREKLAHQLTEIDRELAAFGETLGRGSMVGRKRPRNEASLADSLVNLLKNRVMSVTEAADAVLEAGYQSTSANFRTIVNQTLIKDPRFVNVERGKYKAK